MKIWKVILAALVIFAAGVITGGLTVRLKVADVPASSPPPNYGPLRQRGDLLDRMQRHLYLTPHQRTRIEEILRDSHGRMNKLWDTIAPQAQEEHRRVHELIRAELTPEQQKQYEEMLKTRRSKGSSDDSRRRDFKNSRRTEAGPSTNSPVELK